MKQIPDIFKPVLRPHQMAVEWLVKRQSAVLYKVRTTEKVLALTLDDGPQEQISDLILDLLKELKIPATFFLIGERALRNQELVRRMVEEGHELGNHMWTDYFSVLLTRSEFEKQFLETHRLLTTFSDVKWFRPGGGLYNRRILRRVQEEGYRVALGSVYPYDASHPLVSYSSWHVLNTVTPGSIIILHNATGRGIRTLQVLKQTLPVLLEQGYKFLTLSELSGKDEREVGFQD